MKGVTVLFLGCGDLGIRAGRSLLGIGARVIGVRRSAGRLPVAFETVTADYTQPGSLAVLETLAPDYVVTAFKPSGRDEAGYRLGFLDAANNLVEGLGAHRPRRVLFVSSTRVFAEKAGGWVDEDSPLTTDDLPACRIIDAERALSAAGLAVTSVRCSGIYGDSHGRLLSRIATGQLCPAEPVSYSNRIHRDDAGDFLAHLVRRDDAGDALAPSYIASDDCPVPQHEVELWLAGEMGIDPASLRFDARRMVSGHKRCRNARLHASGYTLSYPDYRVGYGSVLADR
jgi:nucleoside-diphosphate-sugar epimerase